MNISMQSMVVYLIAQIARSYLRFTGQKTTKFEEVREQAALTVTMGRGYAPSSSGPGCARSRWTR